MLILEKIPNEALNSFKSDIIMSSLCSLISSYAKTNIIGTQTDSKLILSYMNMFETALIRPEPHLLETASKSFATMTCVISPDLIDLKKYVDGLGYSFGPPQRSGFALLLGYLPLSLTCTKIDMISDGLIYASKISPVKSQNFAECRRDAIISLTRIISNPEIAAMRPILRKVCRSFMDGMGDFSVEARGDVGSWIREVYLTNIRRLV
jgi:hypothetical protein